jgi:hypothetical protein
MKKTLAVLTVLYSLTSLTDAQLVNSTTATTTSPSTPATGNQGTAYQIVQSDGNSQIWQKTTYETAPDGTQIPDVHQYTELATGLNHLVNGQWIASKEEIDVLADGSGAVATNGQHQVYFPADIYQGEIKMVTPEGEVLSSRPVGLSYDDGSNTVMIAELTNSIGELVGSNQVIYPDAFTGFKADLLYTYTKDGFEQDIILREQPPAPESFNLASQNTRLQLLTEFFDPPQPTVTTTELPAQAEMTLNDEALDFGIMKMIAGRAFLLGADAHDGGVLVAKEWVNVNGQQILVEEVPVMALADELLQLPTPQTTITKVSPNSPLYVVSARRLLPTQRLAKSGNKPTFMAKTVPSGKGLVLDYNTVNGSLTNSTFEGDLTYYISGTVDLFGTNNFEGGAIFKYTNGASLNLIQFAIPLRINTLTGSYRPLIFTARDDNSVGETISGSTGSPSGYYANPAIEISFAATQTVSNFRICYAKQAISAGNTSPDTFYNGQIVNCQSGITIDDNTIYLRNILFANVVTNFNDTAYAPVDVQNSTFNNITYLFFQPFNNGLTVTMTNNILANVTNLFAGSYTNGFSAGYNGFYNSPTFGTSQTASSSYPFQTVGAGSYYLTNGCSFFNAGTTNIDPTLLISLRQKTACPPMVYSNATIATNLTLGPNPQTPRDTNAMPDLGYHYDPLDYVFGGCTLTTNLTITTGTAIGWFDGYGTTSASGQPYGICLNSGAAFNSTGTATAPSWFARYSTVQESSSIWNSHGYMGGMVLNGSSSSSIPQINAQFTKWSSTPGTANFFRDNWAYGGAALSDCEMYGGGVGSYQPNMYFTNCLFFRVATAFWDSVNAATFTYQNCTFYNGFLAMYRGAGQSPSFWTIIDTTFDGTAILTYGDNYKGTNYTLFNYNAYNFGNTNWQTYNSGFVDTNVLEVVGANSVTVTNGYNWETSWFGNFYLPTNSPLIGKGSTNANLLGFFYYTVQTNLVNGYEEIEGTNIVSIGYHYVATDTNGIPLDNLWSGIPDYLTDPNGLLGAWELEYFGYLGVNPNGDPAGDGISNFQKYYLGLNPLVNNWAQSGERSNYSYDFTDWLDGISGVRTGSVGLDNEGNVLSVSQ